jgi:UDP-glucose 4-epimerase
MSNIVITGATGFIGRHLTQALLSKGHYVTCLSRSSSALKILSKNSTNLVTDYSKEVLAVQLENCDVLVHLAGKRLTRDDLPDMIYPFVNDAAEKLDNILYACKENHVKRVITASSIGVYSDANTIPYVESEQPKPATLYGLTKLFSEQRVDFYARKYNTSVAHIRLAQCYGYGEKTTPALMNFIEKAINKEKITLNNGGIFLIDEIYIEDAVDAFIKLIETDKTGSFNIGSGKGYTILEIANTVNTIFNNKDNITILPLEKEVKDTHMDINRALLELHWEPKFSLSAGLEAISTKYKSEKRS